MLLLSVLIYVRAGRLYAKYMPLAEQQLKMRKLGFVLTASRYLLSGNAAQILAEVTVASHGENVDDPDLVFQKLGERAEGLRRELEQLYEVALTVDQPIRLVREMYHTAVSVAGAIAMYGIFIIFNALVLVFTPVTASFIPYYLTLVLAGALTILTAKKIMSSYVAEKRVMEYYKKLIVSR